MSPFVDRTWTSRSEDRPVHSRWRLAVLVLLIVGLGAVLRFHRISMTEPRLWDEGIYFLEARFFSSFSSAVWESGRILLREKLTKEDLWKKQEQLASIRERIQGLPPRYGRVLHDVFLAAVILLVGDKPYVGNLVNASLGTLTIFWVFLLGRIMFNERTGIYAALIFAVMGYHVHYSRSGLAEADSLFFEVAALYYYYRSRDDRAVRACTDCGTAGLFLGLAFTVHNRGLVLAGLILLVELALVWKHRLMDRTQAKARPLLFIGLFLLPSFVWECLYHVFFILFRHLGILMAAPTYVEQILLGFWHSLLWGFVSENFRLAGFFTFPYLYTSMNGVVASLVLLAGIIAAVKRRGPADALLGIWFAVPFVLYSTTNAGLTRFFTLILPPAAILSAASFSWLSRNRTLLSGWKRSVSVLLGPVILLALVVSSTRLSWTNIIPQRSGYGASIEYLGTLGAARVVATGQPLCQVFMGTDRVAKPPGDMAELESLYKEGYRYYVIDYNRIIYTYYQKERVEVMDRIAGTLQPVYSQPNDFILAPQNAFEGNLYFWKTLAMIPMMKQQHMDRIRIYDLKQYFEPEEETSYRKEAT